MDQIFKKIDDNDSRPSREIILEELRCAILDKKLKPGDRLVENNIAKSMGVSRTPVREALRQLEIEGLAINIARKGTLVKGISKKDAVEIYEIREVLEGLAVRNACLNISRIEILRLKEIINEMRTCIDNNDNESYIKSHNEYNEIILNASKNKRLIVNLKSIYEYLKSMRKVSLSYKIRREKALLEHSNIVEAIAKGDEALAERLSREHVVNAKNAFIAEM
ncbi:GntR family transcriptional regulator [Clostridium lundense]|uniref:GntR family transcriptional regulator n=1 Tax=Clostridium lundense TaxID=319475 RepID=UPI000484F4CF|nr:GntR family transcriptional regulator [Clostridium lundense]